MSIAPKVAVVYYSSTGTVHQLAENVARGAREAGAEVRLLRVPELATSPSTTRPEPLPPTKASASPPSQRNC